MYQFEKLKVWQESLLFLEHAYRIISKLPSSERSNLSDQLRRSATSILLNIAEGSGTESPKEFLRFLYIARKSYYEVIAILKIIEKLYNVDLDESFRQMEIVGKLLNGLINSLKTNFAGIAQLARASHCQCEGRGFEPRFPLNIGLHLQKSPF